MWLFGTKKQNLLTLLGRGLFQLQPTIFLMNKWCWKYHISWLFLIHYKLSEKKIWFSSDLEGADWIRPPPSPPLLQETSRSPAPLELRLIIEFGSIGNSKNKLHICTYDLIFLVTKEQIGQINLRSSKCTVMCLLYCLALLPL